MAIHINFCEGSLLSYSEKDLINHLNNRINQYMERFIGIWHFYCLLHTT